MKVLKLRYRFCLWCRPGGDCRGFRVEVLGYLSEIKRKLTNKQINLLQCLHLSSDVCPPSPHPASPPHLTAYGSGFHPLKRCRHFGSTWNRYTTIKVGDCAPTACRAHLTRPQKALSSLRRTLVTFSQTPYRSKPDSNIKPMTPSLMGKFTRRVREILTALLRWRYGDTAIKLQKGTSANNSDEILYLWFANKPACVTSWKRTELMHSYWHTLLFPMMCVLQTRSN